MGCSGSKTTEHKDLGKDKKECDNHMADNHKANDKHSEKSDKNIVIFILGGPGSGKGTQCDKLKKEFNFIHISTGDLLREEQSNNGPNSEYIKETLANGQLVKSDILVELVKAKVNSVKGQKFLLDGFPRNDENIESWNKIIGNSIDPPSVLYFNCSKETMKNRILERAKTSGRSDDNEEALIKRLEVFEHQTVPVVKLYQEKKMVIEVDCEKGANEVFEETKIKLKEKHII